MDKITITQPRNLTVPDGHNALYDACECEVDDLSQVSDGYHTIAELYEHRIVLFIALCRKLQLLDCDNIGEYVWRSRFHSDNSALHEWFILGVGTKAGEQMTYHIPLEHWHDTDFAETLDRAPDFDGHTSADVLKRLKNL